MYILKDRKVLLFITALAVVVLGLVLLVPRHQSAAFVEPATNDNSVTKQAPFDYRAEDHLLYEPQVEQKAVQEINTARQKAGLSELTIDPRLTTSAYWRNYDMYENRKYGHIGLYNERGVDQTTKYYAPGLIAVGEVLDGYDPNFAVDNWINSPEHYKILVDPNATHIGFAYTTTKEGYDLPMRDTDNVGKTAHLTGISTAIIAQE